jgi:two-component system alkaline phosphatase synthesis response regulator PhoP
MAKILVVDDEEHILELIRFNLEKEGYQVVTATDGNTAVEIARSQRPDLILLDVMLPEQDGLAVCRILQQEAATRRIPVIMISARGDELDKVLGLEMGADDYVTKPFSPGSWWPGLKLACAGPGKTVVLTTVEGGWFAAGW